MNRQPPPKHEQMLEDLIGWQAIAPLMDGYRYLPVTGAAMRPFNLMHILNEIVINKRKSIIEFGSGVSTVLIARLAKKNDIPLSVISIEHDVDWIEKLNEILVSDGTDDYVRIVHAPLAQSRLAVMDLEWYEQSFLEAVAQPKLFDMVIVDGPPAWEKQKKLARYPAVPFVIDKLEPEYSIFLDDAGREGERLIIEKWEVLLKSKFIYSGHGLAYIRVGGGYYTEPCAY